MTIGFSRSSENFERIAESTNCLVILNFNCHSELVSESVLDAEMNSA